MTPQERRIDVARWEGQFMALIPMMRPNPIAPYGAFRLEGYYAQKDAKRKG